MFKFWWTPLQLLALVSFTLAICDAIAIERMKGEPGLGGLAPIVYAGFSLGIIIADVILQAMLKNYKNAFFVIEVVLLLVFVVYMYSIGGI